MVNPATCKLIVYVFPIYIVHSYHSNLQNKVRPLQAKVSSMKSSLSDSIDRLKDMEEKYEVSSYNYVRGAAVVSILIWVYLKFHGSTSDGLELHCVR